MNERIKALAFAAGQGGHSWYNDPNCLLEFAKLIASECALQCNHNDDMDNILEHFGVDE